MEGTFINGEKDGVSVIWYSNGTKWQEQRHKSGKPYGIWTIWSVDGKLQSEKFYQDGIPQGQDSLKTAEEAVEGKTIVPIPQE